jgi:hypothetical protein
LLELECITSDSIFICLRDESIVKPIFIDNR